MPVDVGAATDLFFEIIPAVLLSLFETHALTEPHHSKLAEHVTTSKAWELYHVVSTACDIYKGRNRNREGKSSKIQESVGQRCVINAKGSI